MNDPRNIPDALNSSEERGAPIPFPSVSDSATRILESITDAFFALDREWRFTYLNTQAERLLFQTRANLLGKSIWDEFPEAVGSRSRREYQRAVDDQVSVSFEDYHPPLDTWFENHLYPSPDGLSVYFRDFSERKRSEDALCQSEVRLRDVKARLEASLSAGGIATWTLDPVNQRIVADTTLARLFSVSLEDAAGGRLDVYLQTVHPDDRPRVAKAIEDAIAHGDMYEMEQRIVLSDGSHRWLEARGRVERDAEGRAVSLLGVVVDITERVERERRERFLAELAERAHSLTDPEDVIADAVCSLGQFLGVASIEGVVPISAFGDYVVAEYAARRAVAVDDVRLDSVRAPAGSLAAYEAIGIRAHVTVPVVHSDRIVSCISVHNARPRHWKADEVELLRAVVERTWLTVEVTRQQRALVREAEERREEGERTARTLESISNAFFTVDRELWGRTRGELLGMTVWEAWPEAVGTTFDEQFHHAMNEGVAVLFEEFFPPLDAWLEVRLSPSPEGLSVFFQNVNVRKRAEEERERLAERERNIAQQLQAALTPAVPERVPGMALAKYYQAALDEAGVGGDFYDVFPVDKGCTAIVVGDLAGKGLAAATQVATVRNMLRYALYRARTLAGALGGLNSLLAEQELLTGFVTLFVGTYDSGAGTLTYVTTPHA